jgi:hypothetical protein
MGFIEKTESKFGKFAIHGLSLKLAIFQCLIFLILTSSDGIRGIEKAINIINIGSTHFISDFLLLAGLPTDYPVNEMSFIWLFFGCYILVMCGNMLEDLWGSYKFNLFVLSNLLLGTIAMFFVRNFSGYDLASTIAVPVSISHMNFLSLLYVSLFISCAINYPKHEILAFFILPIKFSLLGLILSGASIFIVINSPNIYIMIFFASTLLIPSILFHYKMFLDSQSQKARTAKFTQKVAVIDKQAFHKCQVCGKTENDGDGIEFRISADGEEYCQEHLK